MIPKRFTTLWEETQTARTEREKRSAHTQVYVLVPQLCESLLDADMKLPECVIMLISTYLVSPSTLFNGKWCRSMHFSDLQEAARSEMWEGWAEHEIHSYCRKGSTFPLADNFRPRKARRPKRPKGKHRTREKIHCEYFRSARVKKHKMRSAANCVIL